MRLFFDNRLGKRPNGETTHYVGMIVNANSIAGTENFIRIVMTEQDTIDFFKSWVDEMSKSPVDVTIRKTIYLMDNTNSTTASVSSYIKDFQKDCGWWSSPPIKGAYEVKLIPSYIDYIGSFDKDLLKSIMIKDNRNNKIDKLLDGEATI